MPSLSHLAFIFLYSAHFFTLHSTYLSTLSTHLLHPLLHFIHTSTSFNPLSYQSHCSITSTSQSYSL
ncbi:hypothetical protein BDZ91DRAFT_717959 [Kalaharituber pfeilii]|nr:hypothetical protein BDZ91DRAFT_717959 [Kalaharituber pfeilii]